LLGHTTIPAAHSRGNGTIVTMSLLLLRPRHDVHDALELIERV